MLSIEKQKTLTVSILGQTNVGKSSLINSILNKKISIVTHKKNTTKKTLLTIYTEQETQIIMYDTIGFTHNPFDKESLQKPREKKNFSSIKQSDLNALVLDAKKFYNQNFDNEYLKKFFSSQKSFVLIVNKIDLLTLVKFSELQQYFSRQYASLDIFYVSVRKNIGIEDVVNYFKAQARSSPWLYPEDQYTNASLRFLAAEITRETLLLDLQKEIPHNLSVATDFWKENEQKVIIYQSIIIFKSSQKQIIIGKNGSKIKKIGIDSKIKIQELLGKPVHLYLFVKMSKISQKIFSLD